MPSSTSNTNRVLPQQSHSNPISSISNMHIHQNPAISSPAMGSVRSLGHANSTTPASKVIAQTVQESLSDPQLAGHPSTWSIEQVAYWLQWCGFESVTSSFIDNEISGAILVELNLNNLKELDIASFGKRFNIMNAITSLKQCTKSSAPKSSYGSMSNNSSMYGAGPNIPPRMESAPIDVFSSRSSFDTRGDFTRPQDTHSAHPPASAQPSTMRPPQPPVQSPPQQPPQQPFSNYDIHSNQSQGRSAALARSDTVGSVLSGGSIGEYPGQNSTDTGYGGKRQSIISAHSSNSNQHRNKWDQNAARTPQAPNPAAPQMRGAALSDLDEMGYGQRPVEHQQYPADQYPRPMERKQPNSPEVLHADPYSSSFEQPVPKPRKYHNPDPSNRPQNGKADPSDKVVPLDLIGKPDYAGWLKKRGDTYRNWKSRWFMLKGVTLYYMNSPKENASKDYINLIGYKIIQDENIYAGKYCFKAVHDELRNFYFYTESESEMKGWLKALMKVTIGRDPSAPVISSSNIPTIPLHVARKMAPRPPSPSKRNRALVPNGQPINQQQLQQQQQQYDQKIQQQQLQQQKAFQQQLLDYDDQDSDGEDYINGGYGGPKVNTQGVYNSGNANAIGNASVIGNTNGTSNDQSRTLVPPSGPNSQPQQRHSFVQSDGHGDDDPWRDEDGEGFGAHKQQSQKPIRPDSELDSFSQAVEIQPSQGSSTRWTQEQYVSWINRNIPSTVEPVSDMTQSLRSGVVLVRLIEQISGESVDKRIPNATYTLQMLENLLTAFKFMDRVGISTDGYTVKDIFNGNEDKIILMFEAIRARYPNDSNPSPAPQTQESQQPQLQLTTPSNAQLPPMPNGPAPTTPVPQYKGSPKLNLTSSGRDSPVRGIGKSPLMGSPAMFAGNSHVQRSEGSEYEDLYDEAARSTVS
ncbi:polar growth protein [Haplosporangium sp. Z 27]|nr:polar growth protein [Haplosporangium sp. Z 27]